MKIRDIKKARLEHRSVYCIDEGMNVYRGLALNCIIIISDVLRCGVGLFGSFDSQFDVELTPEYNESTKECINWEQKYRG